MDLKYIHLSASSTQVIELESSPSPGSKALKAFFTLVQRLPRPDGSHNLLWDSNRKAAFTVS